MLVDGAKTISDSWAIANYLDAAYPDRPSLFGAAEAHALTRFVNTWTARVLHAAITIVTDILAHIHEKDRDYFRPSRMAARMARDQRHSFRRGGAEERPCGPGQRAAQARAELKAECAGAAAKGRQAERHRSSTLAD